LLLHMLETFNMYSVLVFSRTKHGADKIKRKLEKAGVVAVAIHSGRTQRQRQSAMDGFKNGKYQVMVATDIAARGIDVTGISHVINFDVPTFAEDYIHRIGRTGRAAATGDAITFVSSSEKKYLRKIEKFINRKFEMQKCESFAYVVPSKTEPQDLRESRQSDRKTRKKSGSKNSVVESIRKLGGKPIERKKIAQDFSHSSVGKSTRGGKFKTANDSTTNQKRKKTKKSFASKKSKSTTNSKASAITRASKGQENPPKAKLSRAARRKRKKRSLA